MKDGMKPKFPRVAIHVNLDTVGGDPFQIMSECRIRAKEAGLSATELNKFTVEAVAGDYGHMLDTVERWFAAEWTGTDPRKEGK